jgi:hypothetical protein
MDKDPYRTDYDFTYASMAKYFVSFGTIVILIIAIFGYLPETGV